MIRFKVIMKNSKSYVFESDKSKCPVKLFHKLMNTEYFIHKDCDLGFISVNTKEISSIEEIKE